jgi:hypothetical protein
LFYVTRPHQWHSAQTMLTKVRALKGLRVRVEVLGKDGSCLGFARYRVNQWWYRLFYCGVVLGEVFEYVLFLLPWRKSHSFRGDKNGQDGRKASPE